MSHTLIVVGDAVRYEHELQPLADWLRLSDNYVVDHVKLQEVRDGSVLTDIVFDEPAAAVFRLKDFFVSDMTDAAGRDAYRNTLLFMDGLRAEFPGCVLGIINGDLTTIHCGPWG